MQYMKDFNKPMNTISQVISNLQMAIASVDRVYEILDMEEEVNGKITEVKFNDSIEFKNVTFAYVPGKPVLKDFSLKIKKGEKIAFVGKTGAGKTTIVNLLMGFFNSYEGEILIDGEDIRTFDKSSYRKLISMVLQDTWLFEGTVKENLLYNRQNVDDEHIKDICREVGLHHFIKTLPKGYDSLITNNESISAGQRQLLTIARGMVEDAPFLILDEATSSIDTRTEIQIQKAMNDLMKGRTKCSKVSTIKAFCQGAGITLSEFFDKEYFNDFED